MLPSVPRASVKVWLSSVPRASVEVWLSSAPRVWVWLPSVPRVWVWLPLFLLADSPHQGLVVLKDLPVRVVTFVYRLVQYLASLLY